MQLGERFKTSNPYQKNRRRWYLPIAPTPDHPDAITKKTKNVFPTLELGHGSTLRLNSYVNIRHVYSIDLSLLQQYYNSYAPGIEKFWFNRTSTIAMLERGSALQKYVVAPQFGMLPKTTPEPTAEPIPASSDIDQTEEGNGAYSGPLIVVGVLTPETVSRGSPAASDRAQEDFRIRHTGGKRRAGPRPKVPPDAERSPVVMSVPPMGQFFEGFGSMATITHQRLMALSYDPNAIKRPLNRAWRDFKGVSAVAIASM
jgi:hypothetical protein